MHRISIAMLEGMHLIPGTRVTQLDSTSVEVSFGNRPTLRFFELTPRDRDWLLALVGPPPLSPKQVRKPNPIVVRQLRSAGLIQAARPAAAKPVGGLAPLSAESSALTAHNLNGYRIAQNRTTSVVAVDGVSRTTLHALLVLARAGVRYFVITDPRPVNRLEFVNEAIEFSQAPTRASAVRDLFAQTMPQCIVLSEHTSVDLVVVNCEDALNPLFTAGLYSQRIAHLVTTASTTHIEVGPFVIPGETGCCNCVLLTRAEGSVRDDFSGYSADVTRAARAGMAAPAQQSAAAAATAGGILAGQVLMYVDGLVPQLTGALAVINGVGPLPLVSPWAAHPDCMCMHSATAQRTPTQRRERRSV